MIARSTSDHEYTTYLKIRAMLKRLYILSIAFRSRLSENDSSRILAFDVRGSVAACERTSLLSRYALKRSFQSGYDAG